MTANQIAYQANLETRRANRAKEEENRRSNLAKETETNRANRMNEYLTSMRDFSKEPLVYGTYKLGEGLAGSTIFGDAPNSDPTSNTQTKIDQAERFNDVLETIKTGIKVGSNVNKLIGVMPGINSIFKTVSPVTMNTTGDKRMKVKRK